LLIGFALWITGSPMSLHGAVPGFVFIFSILILSTMRYTVGPTLVAFFSFAATPILFSNISGDGGLPVDPNTNFFFGTVQNAARWGFLGIATILCLLAVTRRRKTLEGAIVAAKKVQTFPAICRIGLRMWLQSKALMHCHQVSNKMRQ
jgi:hypothetical protein